MTCIYKLYNAGDALLYVGCTNNLKSRLYAHSVNSDWFHMVRNCVVTEVKDRAEGLQLEADAIRTEHPVFNKANILWPKRRDVRYIEELKKFESRRNEMKALLKKGVSQSEIARKFEVSRQRVSQLFKKMGIK